MLEGLYAGAIADAQSRLAEVSLNRIENAAANSAPALNALEFLAPAAHIKILSEIKRSSPSKGSLATINDPVALAKTYAASGASTISVLTEKRRFGGSPEDLIAIRKAVGIPVLRKDFIANEYQILEARAWGADLVLLIVAGLDSKTIARLKAFTEELGMTAFIETHTADEVRCAVDIDAKLLGINARDLNTFETNRNLFGELVPLIPEGVIKVAESAVRSVEDIAHYRAAGADVALVGEALVTGNAAELLKQFTAI